MIFLLIEDLIILKWRFFNCWKTKPSLIAYERGLDEKFRSLWPQAKSLVTRNSVSIQNDQSVNRSLVLSGRAHLGIQCRSMSVKTARVIWQSIQTSLLTEQTALAATLYFQSAKFQVVFKSTIMRKIIFKRFLNSDFIIMPFLNNFTKAHLSSFVIITILDPTFKIFLKMLCKCLNKNIPVRLLVREPVYRGNGCEWLGWLCLSSCSRESADRWPCISPLSDEEHAAHPLSDGPPQSTQWLKKNYIALLLLLVYIIIDYVLQFLNLRHG